MDMAELWCLCEEPKALRRHGDLSEPEVAELYELYHSQPNASTRAA